MDDLISRAALLHSLNEQAPKPTTDDLYTVNLCIINAPAVKAAPVVHGRWKAILNPFWDAECSECGYTKRNGWEWRFCPNCGAKMDKNGKEKQV